MIYEQLFATIKQPETVLAAVVGCGQFGSAIVAQGYAVPRLRVPVVADIRPENARAAYRLAGVPEGAIAECDSAPAALRAMERGQSVIVQDASLLLDLPLHVIVSATRSPEGGARVARDAICHGKHVVMVDKEADSVVGSILKHLADRAGVVYTTEDGDEPGLVMGMVGWAASLGMEVLAAGHTHEVRYDPLTGIAKTGHRTVRVAEEDRWALAPIPPGETTHYVDARARIFAEFDLDEHCGDPMGHLVVMANGTGLLPDSLVGRRPVVRWRELAEVMAPQEEGGILCRRGVIDTPAILTTGDEARASGSIYIVIGPGNRHAFETMVQKGLMANRRGTAALAYRPYHLCGAETPTTILAAGLLGLPTGATEIRPHVDMICQAARDFRGGEIIGPVLNSGWNYDLRASLVPGFRTGPGKPLPFFMLEGNRLAQDVPRDSTFTWEMIERPEGSALWSLRQLQDDTFFP